MANCLHEGEEPPALLVNGGGRAPYVLISEHASNRLPKSLGTLGLPEAELQRHIAWDIGAEQVARLLSRLPATLAPTSSSAAAMPKAEQVAKASAHPVSERRVD